MGYDNKYKKNVYLDVAKKILQLLPLVGRVNSPEKETVHVVIVEGCKNDPSQIGADHPVNILSSFHQIEGSVCQNHWSAETYNDG